MFKRIAIAASAATVLVLLFGMTLVFAHAKYASSTPAAESTIAALPNSVNVTFAEELRAVTLNVVGPDGSTVSTDHAGIDLAERTNASVPIRNGGAGRYTVQWTSVSDEDGDSANGSFGFTLLTTAPPAQPAAPAAQPRTNPRTHPRPPPPRPLPPLPRRALPPISRDPASIRA